MSEAQQQRFWTGVWFVLMVASWAVLVYAVREGASGIAVAATVFAEIVTGIAAGWVFWGDVEP